MSADGGQDGSMIVVATTNLNAKLYKDGQDVSDLLEPYITVDTFVEGVVAYLETVGNYQPIITNSGQGSVCVIKPS